MKCCYCGESEATEKIANPNLDMGEADMGEDIEALKAGQIISQNQSTMG